MKVLVRLAAVALVAGAVGCGSSDGETSAPEMPDVVGEKLDVALRTIEDTGFDDEPTVEGGGTFGVVDESNWTVCAQTPAAGEAISDPSLTVDRSCEDAGPAEEAADTTTVPEQSPADTTAPAETTAPAPETTAPAVLTPDTDAELAAILTEPDECADAIGAFAANNQGRAIELDGHIAAVGPHGDAQTRYDVLVGPGDLSETDPVGPLFQLRDVGIADLNLSGDVPPALEPGIGIHLVAQIVEHDPDQCLVFLDPVSTTIR